MATSQTSDSTRTVWGSSASLPQRPQATDYLVPDTHSGMPALREANRRLVREMDGKRRFIQLSDRL
jgi:hypothetical protein